MKLLAEKLPGVGAVMVGPDNRVYLTPALKDRVKVLRDAFNAVVKDPQFVADAEKQLLTVIAPLFALFMPLQTVVPLVARPPFSSRSCITCSPGTKGLATPTYHEASFEGSPSATMSPPRFTATPVAPFSISSSATLSISGSFNAAGTDVLTVSFNAPHNPFEATPKYLERFPGLTGQEKVYAAMLSALDDAVGRILHSAGEGMKKHPLDPLAALNELGHATEPAPAPEGWSELSGGLKTFAEGLGSVAEGVVRSAPCPVLTIRQPRNAA